MRKINIIFIAILVMISCKKNTRNKETLEPPVRISEIQVHGHRGERGLMPENSIPGFIAAINDGADIIEMDVVISKDHQVVVSHEPFMSSVYVSKPSGDIIAKADEKNYNLYQMPYDSIRKFNIGLKGNKFFPEQQKIAAYKPLLSEVIGSVQNHLKTNNLKPVGYNIELKSDKKEYGISQPPPLEFVKLVMEVLEKNKIQGPVNIQSFDPEILRVVHKFYPDMKLAYLVYEEGIQKNLEELDFVPQIYSPSYSLVKNKVFVDSIKALNMELIPWTVNDKLAIRKMINLDVHGIITDFPFRVKKEITRNKKVLKKW
ncbi:glycerophosphodiester phosphodiesterase family protein [Gillisia hiemivivida]|uniref:Glycerophosphodiester phosphodiesterase n=1 Tax=Gillisia hiemivivida TaxID=291190 RepID=A0A5C7A186_9FLAO|nr:glycerophosphodiester phosphodiesterase family protein [Gillisia hiemivivida]TXD95492.1 glycerophosphodiester phosphodiesterase [Gillisia hiemivivida]